MSKGEKNGKKKFNQGMKLLNRKVGIGNKFEKALKNFQEASDIFYRFHETLSYAESEEMCGFCYGKLEEHGKAGIAYQNAGNSYLSRSKETIKQILGDISSISERENIKAFECLSKSAEYFTLTGKFFSSGKIEKKIAEHYVEDASHIKRVYENLLDEKENAEKGEEEEDDENEDSLAEKPDVIEDEEDKGPTVTQEELDRVFKKIDRKFNDAIDHYVKSIEYFELQNSTGHLNSVLTELGDFCADFQRYKKAVKYYDKLLNAKWNSSSTNTGEKNPMQFFAEKIITKALLCRIANIKKKDLQENLEEIKEMITEYVGFDRNYKKCTEFKLINGLCISFETLSVEKFEEVTKRYSKSHKLKDYYIDVLINIKNLLKEVILFRENEDESLM